MSIILSLVLILPAYDDEKITSENQSKTVRRLDGKFASFDPKAPSNKEKDTVADQDGKQDDKKSESKTYKSDQVEELKKLEGKSATVTGKVVKVYVPDSGNLAVFNFGSDIKKCFKVVIRKKDFEKFGGLEEIKKKFANKEVTVDGKVSMYQNLPQIEVSVPTQLKMN